MAEELTMAKDATPKKVAFMTKPYSNEDKRKKEEDELKQLLEEQKNDTAKTTDKGDTTEQDTDDAEPKSVEERTFKKRYGDLRKHQQQQQKVFEDKISALENQLEKATKKEIQLPKTEEELEEWTKKYPDVAAIVESIAIKKAKEQSEDLESRMKKYETLREEATKEKAEVELLTLHPDFGTIRDSDDFHNWAEEQPKWVQDALYENVDDAKSVARVIDLYKIDKGITNKKKAKPDEKAAASSVKTKSAAAPEPDESAKMIRESEVANMSMKEYEKRADEIMDAQRSGNFIYDISRK